MRRLAAILAIGFVLLYTAQLLSQEWAVDIGAADDSHLLAGFYQPERDTQGNTFRWTAPEAEIWLHGATGRSYALTLRIFGYDSTQPKPRTLRLQHGPELLADFRLASGWRNYHVRLPQPSSFVLDQPLRLQIEPLQGQTADGAARGLVLDQVRLVPLGWPTVWRAVQLTWLCGLLGIGSATLLQAMGSRAAGRRTDGVGHLPFSRTSLKICMGVITVCTLVLSYALWRSPALLGWALPFTPWILGTLSLLLALPLLQRVPAQPRAGIVLLIIAQILLFGQISVAIGLLMALLGMVLIGRREHAVTSHDIAVAPQDVAVTSQDVATLPHPTFNISLLAAILLVALGLRLYKIDVLPYGLWRDEGRHGLVALRMLAEPDYWPAYITSGVDLPGLGLRPFSWAISWWGIHPWSMRILTALAGAGTVLPLYGLTARLFGPKQGLLAAALLACSSWSLTISRFSFPTIFDPLLQLTALWLLARSEWHSRGQGSGVRGQEAEGRSQRWLTALTWVLASICLGLAAQTYHTGRLGILIAAVLIFLSNRGWRRKLLCLSTVAVIVLLTAWPLIRYAFERPQAFNARVGTVFLLSEEALAGQAPLAALDASLGRHVLMMNVHGDDNGRHHAPGRPMLDALTGLALLVGLSLLPRMGRRGLLLVCGLALGLLPSVLAVESPHAMRSINALSFACIIAACGLWQLWKMIAGSYARLKRLEPAVIGLCLAAILSLNACLYFVTMPSNIEVWGSVYPFQTQIGSYIRDVANREEPAAARHLYVPRSMTDNPVFEYLSYGLAVHSYPETGSIALPAEAQLFVTGALRDIELRNLIERYQLDPEPAFIGPALPDQQTPSFKIYHLRSEYNQQ